MEWRPRWRPLNAPAAFALACVRASPDRPGWSSANSISQHVFSETRSLVELEGDRAFDRARRCHRPAAQRITRDG
jgi:hypothetical protein